MDWTRQSAMSGIGEFATPLRASMSDAEQGARIVQGWFLHCDWLDHYGMSTSDVRRASRTTLPVQERLRNLAQSQIPLPAPRPFAEREVGTCRDYALVTCSLLRNINIPARVRCGFASYFGAGWEDHWVCEYQDPSSKNWTRIDAQLDDVLSKNLQLDFVPPHIPDHCFKTAGAAWQECRTGVTTPETYGHGSAKGLWFMAVNVVRDHLALHEVFTSPWDGWRTALQLQPSQCELPFEQLDSLAANPEQELKNLKPFFEKTRVSHADSH